MITRTNPEINVSFLVASREQMEMDRNKVCVHRKEGGIFLNCYSFCFASDVFITKLSADRA